MRPERFAAAYRRDATVSTAYPGPVEAALVEPREWSHRWGVLLHDALAQRRAPSLESFQRFSLAYCGWVNARLPQIGADLAGWVGQSGDLDVVMRAGMELSFHRMNGFAQRLWHILLYTRRGIGLGPNSVNRACYELATTALVLDKNRERLVALDVFFDPGAERARAGSTGILTEIDAYIALLDMTRQRGNVIVLPAPAQFEHLAGPANSDFIVFDKSSGQVRGVQVKAQVTGQNVIHYDRSRVTLIDGARDLQNTRAMRTNPVKSDRRVVAWPGLVAAHFIRDLDWSTATDEWVARKQLIQHKLAARHYTGTIANRNPDAYTAVAERIHTDLAHDATHTGNRAERRQTSQGCRRG